MPRVPGDRLTRIMAALSGPGAATEPLSARLCAASVAVVEVSGAAVTVMSEARHPETVCASDSVAATLVELEFSLGEGPGLDAHRSGRSVMEADLSSPANRRWPAYSEGALAQSVRSVFAFPLKLGAIQAGALELYSRHAGTLGPERVADALVLARIATHVVLDAQARSDPGSLHPDLSAASSHRIAVHQATGMVSVQLSVSIAEAFLRLQGRAYSEGRLVGAVAEDVVNRRIRFSEP